MLGAQIGESKGKRIVRRVLSTDPPTVEVSFEDSGHLFGVPTTGLGTYTSVIRPDGSMVRVKESTRRMMAKASVGRELAWANSSPAAPSATAACCFSEPIPRRFRSAPLAEPSNTK